MDKLMSDVFSHQSVSKDVHLDGHNPGTGMAYDLSTLSILDGQTDVEFVLALVCEPGWAHCLGQRCMCYVT